MSRLLPMMRRLTKTYRPASSGASPDRVEPFVGPQAFRPTDSGRFFGREREIQDLTSLVKARGFITLFARSGLGKSSLIAAGVGPQLEAEGALVLPAGRVRDQGRAHAPLKPELGQGNIFVYNLLSSLCSHAESQGDPEDAYRNALLSTCKGVRGETTLLDFFRALRRRVDEIDVGRIQDREGEDSLDADEAIEPGTRRPIVLLIDQFEEIITHHPEFWQHRADFFKQLSEALRGERYAEGFDSDSYPPLVILAIREDFVGSLRAFRSILPDLEHNTYRLEGLTEAAAEAAILKPLEPGEIEPDFVRDLVGRLREVRNEATGRVFLAERVEPVHLQVVCLKLWEHAQERPVGQRSIRRSDLGEIGGISGILARFYEEEVRKVVDEGLASERRVRTWFDRHLISAEDHRKPIFAPSAAKDVEGLGMEAVKSLVTGYVLHAEPHRNGLLYEITHDRLVSPIHRSNERWKQDRLRRRSSRLSWVVGVSLLSALAAVAGFWTQYERVARWQHEAVAIESDLRLMPQQGLARLAAGFGAVAGEARPAPEAAAVSPWLWKVAAKMAMLRGTSREEIERVERLSPRAHLLRPFTRVALGAPQLQGILTHQSRVLASLAADDGSVLTLTVEGVLSRWQGAADRRSSAPEQVLERADLADARAAALAEVDGRVLVAALDAQGHLLVDAFKGGRSRSLWVDPGLPAGLRAESVALSRDGSEVALGARCEGDGCELTAAVFVGRTHRGPAGMTWRGTRTRQLNGVTTLAFSPDARTLIAGGCSPTRAIEGRPSEGLTHSAACYNGLISILRVQEANAEPDAGTLSEPEHELEVGESSMRGLAVLRGTGKAPVILIDGGDEAIRICAAEPLSASQGELGSPSGQVMPICGYLIERPEITSPDAAAGRCSRILGGSAESLEDARPARRSKGQGTGIAGNWVRRARLLRLPPGVGEDAPAADDPEPRQRSSTLSAAPGGLVVAARGRNDFVWRVGGELAGSRILAQYPLTPDGRGSTRIKSALTRVSAARNMETIATTDVEDRIRLFVCDGQEPSGRSPCKELQLPPQEAPLDDSKGFGPLPLALSAEKGLVASRGQVYAYDPQAARRGDTGAGLSESQIINTITAAAFDRDGRFHAFGKRRGAIVIERVTLDGVAKRAAYREIREPVTCDPTQEPLPNLPWFTGVRDLAFNARGDLLAAADFNRCIRMFRMPTESPMGAPVGDVELIATKQTGSPLLTLAFANRGDTLAAGGMDGTLSVWKGLDAMRPGQPLAAPVSIAFGDRSDALFQTRAAFSHDDSLVLTVDLAGRVFAWDVRDGELIDGELFLHSVATSDLAMACQKGRPMIVSTGIDTLIEGGAVKTVATIRAFDLGFESSARKLYRLAGQEPDESVLDNLRTLGERTCNGF